MIEQCLPMSSRRYYIRLRAQKQEAAMARYQERLTSLRCEYAARNALPSGQQILAEWQISEDFIGEMAVAFLDAAVEACELYEAPLDLTLSTCIENEIQRYIEVQFRYALRNHSRNHAGSQMPANVKDALAGHIPTTSFKILNPIQIRLEEARVSANRRTSGSGKATKENKGSMGLTITSTEQAVLSALGETYPAKVHLHQLAAKIVPPLERLALLQAVNALHTRGLIECVPLKDFAGLQDAANILLSVEGVKTLQQAGSRSEAPATVTVVNVLISSPSDVLAEREAVEEAIHEWNAITTGASGSCFTRFGGRRTLIPPSEIAPREFSTNKSYSRLIF